MAVLDNPTWLFNLSAPERDGLIERFDAETKATTPSFILGDGNDRNFILVTPRPQDSRQPWDYFDPVGHTVEFGIFPFNTPPTGGTWDITYGANISSGNFYNISSANLEIALNALASIIAAGGVAVTAVGNNGHKVTFASNGVRTMISAVATSLSPDSRIGISRTTTGSASVREVQVIRLNQYYAYSAPATVFPVAACTPASLQTGTASLPSIQRIKLDPEPYAGAWILAFSAAQVTRIETNGNDGEALEVSEIVVTSPDVAGNKNNKVAGTPSDKDGPVQIVLTNGGTVPDAPIGGRNLYVAFVNGDSAATLATKITAAVDADAEFAAVASTNRVTITDDKEGPRDAIIEGDAAFTVGRLTQGFHGRLHDTYLTLYDSQNNTYGIYITETGADPAPGHAVLSLSRYDKYTIGPGDSDSAVASAINTDLTATADFNSSVSGTIITVTNADNGLRTEAEVNTSTFGVTTTSHGATISALLPWNATADEVLTGIGEDRFVVEKTGDFQWDIAFLEVGAKSLFTTTVTALKVPVGRTGPFSTDSTSLHVAFAALVAGVHELTAYLEGVLTLSGKLPLTFYRQSITIYRDAIP